MSRHTLIEDQLSLPLLTKEEALARLGAYTRPWHSKYLAMYSSQLKGITRHPAVMCVPMDDHLVHRGDGVFDTFKVERGKAYRLPEHLARLERSASAVGLAMPGEYEHILEIIKAVARAGGEKEAVVRVIVSRGPGGLSADPYECPESQLYILAYRLKRPSEEAYELGVKLASANVPWKPAFFARIKTVDYLTNVLVKKAALDAGADYGVAWDGRGHLADGATENVLVLTEDGRLLSPEPDRILKGVTLGRVLELADTLVAEGLIRGRGAGQITAAMATQAREVMLTGTTLDVLPVTRWDGKDVADGQVGAVAMRLRTLLREDIENNAEALTPLL